MILPKKLKKGDKVALVSLSSGLIGEKDFRHKFIIAKKWLEEEFGLELVPMKNSLKGIKFLYENPKARADDLIEALLDDEISAIFSAIGGDDTIRIMEYIDLDIISKNPKIFMGYSDTTINHFMMRKANVLSFYGPAIMTDFGEYVEMNNYTKQVVLDLLFETHDEYYVTPSQFWSSDYVPWGEKQINIKKQMMVDSKGYEVLQGTGSVTGKLLGGCIETFPLMYETKIWPRKDEWKNVVLFLETSEIKTPPESFKILLRSLAVQGVFNEISAIIIGKPYQECYYEEYKAMLLDVLNIECNNYSVPIFYNINIGHAIPTGIFPIGAEVKLNCEAKTICIKGKVVE